MSLSPLSSGDEDASLDRKASFHSFLAAADDSLTKRRMVDRARTADAEMTSIVEILGAEERNLGSATARWLAGRALRKYR